MKVSRGAHSAISSCESTGMSPAFLLPNVASEAPYFMKLPAIQWYSPSGQALDGFAPVAAMQLGAAFAGRADQHHGEALIEGHGDQRGLAVARDAFDADVLRVDGWIGFEIVEPARGAPRPGAQRAPVVGLARLALVDQADDAAREAAPLSAWMLAGLIVTIAPAVGDELLGRGRIAACSGERGAPKEGARAAGGLLRRILVKIACSDGIALGQQRFERRVDRSHLRDGCAGAGSPAGRTSSAPAPGLWHSPVTSVIWMFTLIAG